MATPLHITHTRYLASRAYTLFCGKACRCLDFLLAAASTQQWVLPKLVAAGIMPILEAVLTAYSEATKANAADGNFWSHNAILNTEEPSDCDSSGSPVPTTKPSGTAVMSCLSLMEVIPAGLANLHVTPCLSQNGLLDHAQQCFQQDPSHCRQFWHLPKAIKGHKCTMGDALQAIGSAALLYSEYAVWIDICAPHCNAYGKLATPISEHTLVYVDDTSISPPML